MQVLERQNFFIQEAEVIGVDTTNRTISVQWLNMESTSNGVILASPSNDFSFPRVGDYGVVIGNGNFYYWVAKIDPAYAAKIEGKIKDKEAKIAFKYPNVGPGEVHIANIPKQTFLKLSNVGDISLMNGVSEGFKYVSNIRSAKVAGKIASVIGNGVKLALGTAMRNIPGAGEQPVVGISGGGKALEFLMQIIQSTDAASLALQKQLARLHIGEIKDLVSGLVDELSGLGLPLRFLLELNQDVTGLLMSSIKADSGGNIEVKAGELGAGILSLDSGMPATSPSIMLGPIIGTIEAVIKGTTYALAESTYLTAENTWVVAENALITAINSFSATLSAAATVYAGVAIDPAGAVFANAVVAACAALTAAATTASTANGTYATANSTFAGRLVPGDVLSQRVMTS